MNFLSVSTNTKDVSPFIAAEFQRLDELRAAGTITDASVKGDSFRRGSRAGMRGRS